MRKLGKRGFTLVEIMIVVAIIALLAAIAIPNLLRARHNANESSAIASMRTISTAMESYRAARTPPTYVGGTLANLAADTPPYIDATLGTGTKQGYTYQTVTLTVQQYLGRTRPQRYQTSGTRSFTVDESGVIRGADVGGGWLARGAGAVIE